MKKLLGCFITTILILFLVISIAPTTAKAVPIWGSDASGELTGSRTSPSSSGIDATGPWDGGYFEVTWSISPYDSGYWKYEYTITSSGTDPKAISHFILEVSQGGEFYIHPDSDTVDGPQVWSLSPGNPDMPNDIYGVKFDFGDNPITYTLITDRDPVYGVFYAKDGTFGPAGAKEDVVAWSNALNFSDYKTTESLTVTDFIVRPNGISVPEPATMLLFGTGILCLGVFGRKRFKG